MNSMFAGVTIGGVIAAPGLSASDAVPEVHPGSTDRQTLDTPTGRHRVERNILQLDAKRWFRAACGGHGGKGSERAGPAAAQSWCSIGSVTLNVVRPGSDSSVSSPRCLFATIVYEILSPRPVPEPGGFVVKKESKTLS